MKHSKGGFAIFKRMQNAFKSRKNRTAPTSQANNIPENKGKHVKRVLQQVTIQVVEIEGWNAPGVILINPGLPFPTVHTLLSEAMVINRELHYKSKIRNASNEQ